MNTSIPRVHITVLGSGTSAGVPTIGCSCSVCTSSDPRDTRLRPSILIRYDEPGFGERAVLIDTTPDFRAQALRTPITRIDAILYTHSHADHILGLDDVRPFNYRQKQAIPLYGAAATLQAIQRVFGYAFEESPQNTMVPRLNVNPLSGEPFCLFGLEFTPVTVMHGNAAILGYRFGNAAYLTDHSEIPEASKAKLLGLDVLFLDALRHRPHPTHSTVAASLKTVEELKPRRTFFTHICHDLAHAETDAALPRHVRLAFDGLEIDVDGGLAAGMAGGTACPTTNADGKQAGDKIACPTATVVTIGNFDGVHIGHRHLLREVVEAAAKVGAKPAVLTFDPHPARVVAPERAPRLLSTMEERRALMAAAGIDEVMVLPFTAEVARLSPEEFVRDILVAKLGAKVVLVGENFRFGHKQAGDMDGLIALGKRYGFEVRHAESVTCRGQVVSSSAIRKFIETGDVGMAWRFLGRPYSIVGDVVRGRGVGSKVTVPTINMTTAAEVLPATGVYVTRTLEIGTGRRWNSISNIGYRPTFESAAPELSIETFLLDPLFGDAPSRIVVTFLHRVREEKKFESPELLKAQIFRDVKQARSFFRLVALGNTKLGRE
jgi:riboflavin kinase/FMN adenylyltransferase